MPWKPKDFMQSIGLFLTHWLSFWEPPMGLNSQPFSASSSYIGPTAVFQAPISHHLWIATMLNFEVFLMFWICSLMAWLNVAPVAEKPRHVCSTVLRDVASFHKTTCPSITPFTLHTRPGSQLPIDECFEGTPHR